MHFLGPIRLAASPLRGLWCGCCLLVFALPAGVLAQSLEHARRDGLSAGARDGKQAGSEAGYAAAFAAAEQQAFAETLRELAVHGNVHTPFRFKAAAWACGLAAGWLAQWLLMYFLRRVCRLPDIDWMVFPGRLTEISVRGGCAAIPPQALERITPLLILLAACGCADSANDVWSRAYQLQFDIDYREAAAAAAAHGTADGRLAGIYRAAEAARSGETWRLYSVHAVSAALAGAVLGLLAQYTHLVCMRQSGRLHGLWSLILVPGITSSYAYRVYLRRREFLVWMKDELIAVRANQRLHRARLDSVQTLIHNQAVKLADLDQFLQARLLEAAHDKMAEIVAAAEQAVLAPEDDVPPAKVAPAGPARRTDRRDEAEDQHTPRADSGEPGRLPPVARWMPMIDSLSLSADE